MRRILRRPDQRSRYFPGKSGVVRVLYRPFFTRKKPSMAFFRWGGPSVRLGFTPEKPFHESIEPAVTPSGGRGFFVFCDSSPADAGACGVACRVSIAPHFALHFAADLTGVVASASAAFAAPAVPPFSGKTVMPLVDPDHG